MFSCDKTTAWQCVRQTSAYIPVCRWCQEATELKILELNNRTRAAISFWQAAAKQCVEDATVAEDHGEKGERKLGADDEDSEDSGWSHRYVTGPGLCDTVSSKLARNM